VIEQLVKRGLHRAAGEQHVVHEDHDCALNITRNLSRCEIPLGSDDARCRRDETRYRVSRAGNDPRLAFWQARAQSAREFDASVRYSKQQQGFPSRWRSAMASASCWIAILISPAPIVWCLATKSGCGGSGQAVKREIGGITERIERYAQFANEIWTKV
jgi:hypothetical protein